MNTTLELENVRWYCPKEAPFSIHGLCETERDIPYHRLPDTAVAGLTTSPVQLRWNTAGGRIRFATDSPYIAIHAVPFDCGLWHRTYSKCSQSGFDMYMYDDDGKLQYCKNFMPPDDQKNGCDSVVYVKPEMRTYSINMPLYDGLKEVFIGLSADATVVPARPYTYTKPVVYYGSSITQGCSSRPGNSYEAFIERQYDTDYINLGFSGGARGDLTIAKYIASLDLSVLVCDYDHNAPTVEFLKETHEPFFNAFRAKHSDTPVIFVTRPAIRKYTKEEQERRAVVYDTFCRAKASGDQNVYFIDGETLLAGPHQDSCTLDGCHPNDLGYYRMAQVIGSFVEKLL